ncbi:MAG: hypothetical protein ACO1OB_20230 [Archangium sp.]
MRVALLALCLAACTKDAASTETRSTKYATARDRITFLRDFAAFPSEPKDAAWHIYETDEGTVVHAVVKIDPSDAHVWSMGCGNYVGDARPKWLPEVLAGTGWNITSLPDTWRCGREKRGIHVKEGFVVRATLVPKLD